MKVSVTYASVRRQAWLDVELADGATVRDAIDRSGMLRQFPEIDLAHNRIGVFSKFVTLETALADGDRVEIYRPITCDPKTVKRRAKAEGAAAGADD